LGVNWSAPYFIADGLTDAFQSWDYQSVIAASNQTVAVLFTSNRTADEDLYYQKSSDGGLTWDPVVLFNSWGDSDSGTDNRPTIVTDGIGLWIVVWSSNYKFGSILGGSATDLLWVYSNDSLASWTQPSILNAGSQKNPSANDGQPKLIMDSSTSTFLY
jgi:hypothetical protein